MKDSNPKYSGTAQSQLNNDLFRELCIVWLATNVIDVAPRQVRRALEKQVLGVVDAITAFGFRIPILVRKSASGERYQVVDGHIRLEAARRLGAEHTDPYLYSPQQVCADFCRHCAGLWLCGRA